MITKEDLEIKKHALDMMAERGISENEIIQAIIKGAKIKQNGGLLAHHGYITIAYYKTEEGKYRIKTVMYDFEKNLKK